MNQTTITELEFGGDVHLSEYLIHGMRSEYVIESL
jgi:hypothetical protein